MSHHLGFKPQGNSNQQGIKTFIHSIDSAMDIVLILERFDESLLLMKRLFKWDLHDILHLSLFSSKFFKHPEVHLPPNAEEIHKIHSPADYALYQYFEQKLDTKVQSQGKTFQTELEDFKAVQTQVQTFCLTCCNTFARVKHFTSPGFAKYTIMKQIYKISSSMWHTEIQILCLTCLDMLVGTSLYLDAITVRQWPQECGQRPDYCNKYEMIGQFPFGMLRRSAYFNLNQCQSAMQ